MKRPAFQFYPADWRKDAALQSCSLAAQGLWINALCVAHECEPYGHLTINGQAMSAAQLGRLVGASAREAAALIEELMAAGVASRSAEGVIFSRRMVRDEDVRNRRAEGGKGGAEHGAKGAEYGAKGGRPPKARGVSEPPLEPPPSSSSSSSASATTMNPSSAGASAEGRPPGSWADWARWWRESRGIEVDPRDARDRKRFVPLAERWIAAGVTPEQMRRAIVAAERDATEPIAYLPAYVDRVLASQQAPPRATALDAQAEVLHRITGGMHGQTTTDSRTIDVDTELAPRLAIGSR